MLRTFDELGYRQEQRFHFELGLLKLVHLRRLLPVEEVLSSIGATATPRTQLIAPRNADQHAEGAQRCGSRRPRQASLLALRAGQESPRATMAFDQAPQRALAERARYPAPAPEPVRLPPMLVRPVTEPVADAPSPSKRPPQPRRASSLDPPAEAADAPVAAEARRGRASCREAILRRRCHGRFGVVARRRRWSAYRPALSKTMLPIIMNADAEKIVRAAIRSAGANKLTLVAAAATQTQHRRRSRASRKPGSAQAKAMEHPMVQQAQRLFDAEIQTVIDLSDKE